MAGRTQAVSRTVPCEGDVKCVTSVCYFCATSTGLPTRFRSVGETANAVLTFAESNDARLSLGSASSVLSLWWLSMYLLFVDESGTHPGNHPFVLGGIAIHEDDAERFQSDLDQVVIDGLGRVPANLEEYEIHASEMRNAKKPREGSQRQASIWAGVTRDVRARVLNSGYELMSRFEPSDPNQPVVLFGVAVERNYHPDWSAVERERLAYEVLLGKFDGMLKTFRESHGVHNRGLVIHDRRVVAERDIQSWTAEWRRTAERIAQLRNLADVPLFGDSRATRLLQAADLVSYGVFRAYNKAAPSAEYFDKLWSMFHSEGEAIHGAIHYTPEYGRGTCDCKPCAQRLIADAVTQRPRRPWGARSRVRPSS